MKAEWLRHAKLWIPALLFGGLVWAHRWICDDGFIYLHVADNLLAGLGPVFNPGERVEAYASPLWLLLLSFFGALLRPGWRPEIPPFEWIAVGLGVVCSIGAYAAASIGANRLFRSQGRGVPAGAVVVLGLVPFWDFGTSGLESGLVLLWLGLSFAGTVRLRDEAPKTLRILAAICVGLGPLVRPDLGIFSALLGLVVLLNAAGWRRRLELLAAAIALPLAYQLFRMGYFACLVPNTAIAKEASVAAWDRGWLYFLDFETTYQMWIPLLALAAAAGWACRRFQETGDTHSALLAVAPALGGVLYGLYIVRVGGDFLHARMLLPAVFALALPVFTLPLRPAGWLVPVLIGWAIGSLAFARVQADPEGIGVERGRLEYIALSKNDHPVTETDHRGMNWHSAIDLLDQIHAARGDDGSAASWFYSPGDEPPLRWADLRSWVSPQVQGVAYLAAIGLFGYQARQRIYICDHFGLADPYAARTELLKVGNTMDRGKAGHEKGLQEDWCLAHLVEALDGRARYSPAVGDLANALACGDLAELQAAVDEPLSWGRFWRNVRWSARLTRLRIPHDPSQARARFCEGKPSQDPY